MKRKIVWIVVSCLMVLSLVMASCAPAVVEEEVIVEEEVEVEVEEEVVAPTDEKPKYGGVLRIGQTTDITVFDDVVGRPIGDAHTLWVTNEQLLAGDWTKGAAGGYGTNATTWPRMTDVWDNNAGYIAESWEFPTKIEGETATIIYHIRQGVHWALNPDSEASRLVGGRELTADDVVFSLKQIITDKRAFIYKVNPPLRAAKITSPAPWIVKVEFPWEDFELAVSRFSSTVSIVPPEVVAKYDNMRDWKLSVGTGPFMLTDVVPGSTATLVRNPNYWMKDPIGPGKGNQLPYLDGVKYLIIPDQSTLYAALRTAKVDQIGGYKSAITGEDADTIFKTTPQIMSGEMGLTQVQHAVAFKLDRPPFNDIRVRRAMLMATDFEAIKRDLYGGNAQILTWPITYVKDYADAYLGLDDPEMPESVRELYSYNPEKARALLAEAGYPDGFKTDVILLNTGLIIDYYSIIKDMWSKVGVDLTLDPRESGVISAIYSNHNFDQLFANAKGNTALLYKMQYYRGTGAYNLSEIDDPVVNEYYPKIQMAIVTSRVEANRLHKELMKYVLDQAWAIPRVSPVYYLLWWPWLKNYSGEESVGYLHRHFFNWVWIDQGLKKSMGY